MSKQNLVVIDTGTGQETESTNIRVEGTEGTIHSVEQSSAPSNPDTDEWGLYFKSDGLYFIDDAGNETGPLIDASGAVTDHGSLTGLSDDDHSQYALLAGRSGGQTLIGGTDASDNLTIDSTANATKGVVHLPNSTMVLEGDPALWILDNGGSAFAQFDIQSGTDLRLTGGSGVVNFDASSLDTSVLSLVSDSGVVAVTGGVTAVAGDISATTGRIRIGTGDAATPGLTPVGDPDTGIFAVGANDLGFSTAGVRRGRVGSTGIWQFEDSAGNRVAEIDVTSNTINFGNSSTGGNFQMYLDSGGSNAASIIFREGGANRFAFQRLADSSLRLYDYGSASAMMTLAYGGGIDLPTTLTVGDSTDTRWAAAPIGTGTGSSASYSVSTTVAYWSIGSGVSGGVWIPAPENIIGTKIKAVRAYWRSTGYTVPGTTINVAFYKATAGNMGSALASANQAITSTTTGTLTATAGTSTTLAAGEQLYARFWTSPAAGDATIHLNSIEFQYEEREY